MKVVVTGATGYIGGRLAASCAAAGDEVGAVVRPSSDTARLEREIPGVRLYRYDGDVESLSAWLARHSVEAVMHLAAHQDQSGSLGSVRPLVRANVEFTAELAAAAADAGVAAFVGTGTFSQHLGGTSAYEPATLYAATKQAAFSVLEHYRRTGPMSCVTLELTDVYGPGDTRGKLLDLIMGASETGERLALTPGGQLMSLVHVDDVVRAYTTLARGMLAGQRHEPVYSVAAARLMTLREAVELLLAVTGRTASLEWGGAPYPPRRVMEPFLYDPPPGWRPEITPETGFARVFGTENT